MEFRDRKTEQKEIKEVLNSNKFELLILYGRRRVGKTELILETTKHKKRLYYLATTENNLERFYNESIKFDQSISNLKKDWEVLFDYIKDKTEVIVIDEFQNLIKENKNIISLFQAIVDTKLNKSKVKLILLGSSISIINSKVLSYKSPLFGRRTASIKLRPISFVDLKEFFPKASIKELIEIYSLADGIPFYLIKIEKDFWEWLEKEIKQEKSFIRDEVDFLTKYEFENSGTYKLILEAIANGKNTLNEIKNYIKVERTDLSQYIKNLLEVELIKREVPILDNIKSRNGRYFLKDNFLSFWFRFIYPNLSGIESNLFEIDFIKKNYAEYLGKIFENCVKETLIKKKAIEFNKIGRWWHKEKEIDLIAINEKNNQVTFIECKYKDNMNPTKILMELKEKSKYFNWRNEKRNERFIIFAKSFKERIKEKDLELYDIRDLESFINLKEDI